MHAFNRNLIVVLAAGALGLAGCDKSTSNDEKTNKSGPGTPAQPNEQRKSDPHSPSQPGPAVAPQGAAPTSTPTAAVAPPGANADATPGEAPKPAQ